MHGDPEPPTPVVSDHAIVRGSDLAAIDAFVAAAGAGSTLVSAELRQLGGAVGRSHPGGGALPGAPGRPAALRRGARGRPGLNLAACPRR
ncbi:MAG TPA: hypothetical protein VNT55_13105 [Baekduia sp.]|nr:hypothetical protein [Baekduia sp.]